jgi:carboxymethylenebutenolidase
MTDKDTDPHYEVRRVDVAGSEMEVFLFEPDGSDSGSRRYPALILAQHIPVGHAGLEHDTFTLASAARFARAGYVVAVPFIFHWWPKSADITVKRDESTDQRTVADVKAAFDLLRSRCDVDAQRIGIVGHCWGGRVAWLGACHVPQLAACAIFYGGRIKLAMGEGSVPAISLASQIQCPVAGFFGAEDRNPTPADVDDYEAALRQAGVDYEFTRYPEAGHAFQNFPTPERYHHEASEDAWDKVLEFLQRTLGEEAQ